MTNDARGGLDSMNVGPLGHSVLTEEMIRDRLGSANGAGQIIPPEGVRWRRAAVLVPLLLREGEWNLLYIRRTQTVETHRGQVAFPGGAMDDSDATLEETALRETYEEVGLPAESVKILGRLPDFYTISDFLVTPVVGVIPWPFALRLSTAEVDRAFTIPLSWMADRDNYEERPLVRFSGSMDKVVYYQEYDGEVVWGATGMMTRNFLQTLGLLPVE